MRIKKYMIAIVTILVLVLLILIREGNIGVSKSNMEKDARKAHKIQDNWSTASSINDDFGAFLFYDEDLSDYTFSIYQKRSGFPYRYFFRYGGSMPDITEKIRIFKYDGKGSIILSLNKMKVAKIEMYNGSQQNEVIVIDPDKPFSIIIPNGVRETRIYNIYGDMIPIEEIVTEDIHY